MWIQIIPSNQGVSANHGRMIEYLRVPQARIPKAGPPPPPRSPKANPPVRPPPLYLTNASTGPTLTARTLNSLNQNFHPPLLYVESLTSPAFRQSQQTRTGVVHPPLPVLDRPTSHTETTSSSGLRTTADGIRLEITPAAMIQRRVDPEEFVPPATPPTPQSSSRPSLPPELDPES